jgi:hypothetical protein
MRISPRFAVTLAVLAGSMALMAQSDPTSDAPKMLPNGVYEIAVPAAAKPGENLDLHLSLGPMAPRARVMIKNASDGTPIGTISPFGMAGKATAGDYVVPVPSTHVVDGQLRIKVEVEPPAGAAPRAAGEGPPPSPVTGLSLKVAPSR